MVSVPKDMVKGYLHSTLFNGDLVVVGYSSASAVEIQFIGYEDKITVSSNLIRKKVVKNPMLPLLYSKGYVGIGPYSNRDHKKAYVSWVNMLRRCYCVKDQEKHPTYKDCTVDSSWYNFQNFAVWFYENYVENYELDKDLKFQGNKVYSKDTCIFVPKNVNRVITDSMASRSKYGIGVAYHKASGRLVVGCNDGNKKRVHLGYFSTENLDEARKTYFEYKYKIIKEMAYKQKDENIKHHLLNWVIPKNN